MNNRLKKLIFHTLILAVLAVFMIPMMAYADTPSCEVKIPVTVQISGSEIPAGTNYRVELERVTPDAPMPDVTVLTITDGGSASFGPITYTVPNDYVYRVRQNSESANYFTYDSVTYRVTVRIVNSDDGLTSEVWAVNESLKEGKTDNVVFNNTYTAPSIRKTSSSSHHSGGGDSSDSGSSGSGSSNSGSTPAGGYTTGSTPRGLSGLPALFEEVKSQGLLPKTGDASQPGLWILLMLLSAAGIVLLMICIKHGENKDE